MPELSELRLMPTETARRCVYLAVKMELRYLRWSPWRKGTTAADVLNHHGVEAFADGIVNRLAGMCVTFRDSNVESKIAQPFVWPPQDG